LAVTWEAIALPVMIERLAVAQEMFPTFPLQEVALEA
jgi:hypothetical protein